jgi:hypothetical protein
MIKKGTFFFYNTKLMDRVTFIINNNYIVIQWPNQSFDEWNGKYDIRLTCNYLVSNPIGGIVIQQVG